MPRRSGPRRETDHRPGWSLALGLGLTLGVPTLPAIICEISTPRTFRGDALADIAKVCANDVGVLIVVKKRRHAPREAAGPLITLHLPVELIIDQHRVWCLACRLACFCADARVSVLVIGPHIFHDKPQPRSLRHTA